MLCAEGIPEMISSLPTQSKYKWFKQMLDSASVPGTEWSAMNNTSNSLIKAMTQRSSHKAVCVWCHPVIFDK